MTTKVSGLGFAVAVDDSGGTARTISNSPSNLQFATPRGVQDVTGVDKSAREILLLLADFSITLNGAFDPGANMAHAVFKTVPSTSVARTTTLTISGQTLAPEVLYSDYSLNRGADGSFTWSATGANADGAVPTWS